MIKSSRHIIKGIQQDNSVGLIGPEYAYDAQNIRLTAREDGTLLAITNEKGNKEVVDSEGNIITLEGTVLGYCVLNNYVTVFTTGKSDYIYRLEKKGEYFECKCLFEGSLNFKETSPIETLGVYEKEDIQKVYWVDGVNQPRVINIVDNKYTNFDFVQTLSLTAEVEIERVTTGNGKFKAGTIQYAFTYYNKYLQESNIFYTSPLQYISYNDRGASAEDNLNCAFKITLTNLEDFEYVRIYSIHRSTIDATPVCTRVADLEITDKTLSYIDTGDKGEAIDTTELLYIGGESIIANTITSKDNTLFLGNITLQKPPISESIKSKINNSLSNIGYAIKEIEGSKPAGYYAYTNQLKEGNNTTFKSGEHYRLGVQFQYKDGKWSEPVHIGDYTVPLNVRPDVDGDKIKLPYLTYTLPAEAKNIEGFVKVRPLVVFPSVQERKVLTQGMLCPTVFRSGSRENNTPFAQSSWFLRPNEGLGDNIDYNNYKDFIKKGALVEYRHLYPLQAYGDRGAEIQNVVEAPSFRQVSNNIISNVDNQYENVFFVDKSIVTLHSPEVAFDESFNGIEDIDFKLRIVGLINFTSSIGDIDIETSSPTIGSKASGFYHKTLGVENESVYAGRSLVSGLFYKDWLVDDSNGEYEANTKQDYEYSFLIYPWQKQGALNNDITRPNNKGTTSSVLQKKRISNLKYSSCNTWLNQYWENDNISPVYYFNSDDVTLTKIKTTDGYRNYYGNVDTIITSSQEYSVLVSTEGDEFFTDSILKSVKSASSNIGDKNTDLLTTKAPVRMKYKSTPHLVFGFNKVNGVQDILPTPTGNELTEEIIKTTPFWEAKDLDFRKSDYILVDYSQNTTPPVRLGKTWIKATVGSDGSYVYTYWECVDKNYGYFKWEQQELNVGDKYRYERLITGTTNYYITYFEAVLNLNGEVVLQQVDLSGSNETHVKQDSLGISLPQYSYLYMAELYRDNVVNAFGRVEDNLWLPAGEPVNLNSTIKFTIGDTWYQRYDCLKTYPYTTEDENQIVEIASFMCETRVNIDGRYDRNRGQNSNLNMSPTNFNLLNKVYSQSNNYFNYRLLEKDFYKTNTFPTTITWSKEKSNAEDVDTWTNITMASTLDLDGSKGAINSLNTFNSSILCFQDKAISNILFNSRVQIPTSDGQPIEITNGLKVEGKRYISENVGCNNKWSIVVTPSAVYFIDNDSKGIYAMTDSFTSISERLGLNTFVNNSNTDLWNPKDFKGFVSFYDNKNKDVYFTNADTSLVYSERLGQFSSFMDYGSTPYMFNIGENYYAIKDGKVWHQFAGEYNTLYNIYRPFSITYISNNDMPYDKTFNTIEYRADFWDKEVLTQESFDTLEVWNEYQKGIADLKVRKNRPSVLKKKFRIWRANIPRDMSNNKDRIRNTWAYVKLSKETENTYKMQLHDVEVKYFV